MEGCTISVFTQFGSSHKKIDTDDDDDRGSYLDCRPFIFYPFPHGEGMSYESPLHTA